MKDYLAELCNLAHGAAEQADRLYRENIHRQCFLYCGRGKLWVQTEDETTEDSPSVALVTGETVPRNRTVAELTGWIVNNSKRAPVYTEPTIPESALPKRTLPMMRKVKL